MDGIDLEVKKKDSTLLIKVNREEKKKLIDRANFSTS